MSVEVPEGWHVQSINEFSEVVSGSTPDTFNPRYWDGNIVWITPDDLSKNEQVYVHESTRRISDLGLKNSSAQIIPRNSIVMSSRAPIGYLAIVTSDYTTNQGCKSLRLRNSVIPEFVYYALLFNMDKIKQKGEGTTFAEISKKELERVSIFLPKSLPEQKKIASILQCVGNAIGKTKEVIEKHKKMKQGLMQNLFARGVDESGSLREEGVWDKLRIRSVAFVADIDHKMPEDVDFGIPFISSKDITEDGDIVLQGVKQISEKDYRRLARKIEPKNGDIIYSRIGTIGRVALVKRYVKFLMSYSCCVIRKKDKKIEPSYLAHVLRSQAIERQILKETQSIGVPDLGLDKIYDFEILLPRDRNEQQRIAGRLDALDLKIKAEQTYLSKLLKIKTGLMQDLLTGKVRVAA